ncbi:hypothetical protein EB093_08100, partial [bacterium]|nr:hypothetical protein [bacterium]
MVTISIDGPNCDTIIDRVSPISGGQSYPSPKVIALSGTASFADFLGPTAGYGSPVEQITRYVQSRSKSDTCNLSEEAPKLLAVDFDTEARAIDALLKSLVNCYPPSQARETVPPEIQLFAENVNRLLEATRRIADNEFGNDYRFNNGLETGPLHQAVDSAFETRDDSGINGKLAKIAVGYRQPKTQHEMYFQAVLGCLTAAYRNLNIPGSNPVDVIPEKEPPVPSESQTSIDGETFSRFQNDHDRVEFLQKLVKDSNKESKQRGRFQLAAVFQALTDDSSREHFVQAVATRWNGTGLAKVFDAIFIKKDETFDVKETCTVQQQFVQAVMTKRVGTWQEDLSQMFNALDCVSYFFPAVAACAHTLDKDITTMMERILSGIKTNDGYIKFVIGLFLYGVNGDDPSIRGDDDPKLKQRRKSLAIDLLSNVFTGLSDLKQKNAFLQAIDVGLGPEVLAQVAPSWVMDKIVPAIDVGL